MKEKEYFVTIYLLLKDVCNLRNKIKCINASYNKIITNENYIKYNT